MEGGDIQLEMYIVQVCNDDTSLVSTGKSELLTLETCTSMTIC